MPPRIFHAQRPVAELADLPRLEDVVAQEPIVANWQAFQPQSAAADTFTLTPDHASAFAQLIRDKTGVARPARCLAIAFARDALLAALETGGWHCERMGPRWDMGTGPQLDAVLALGFALNAFLDCEIAVLAAVATRRLRPGGLFVCEMPSLYHACKPVCDWSQGAGGLVLNESAFDPIESALWQRHIVARGECMHETAAWLRVLSCNECVRLLQANGLTPFDIRGNWDQAAYTETSPRLIVFARKS